MSDCSLIYSYGSMMEIAPFFKPIEVLKLQALNRWMYLKGVCRVQATYKLP